ncbi:MAG: sulfotransferase [Pseudomonadota bacterium]
MSSARALFDCPIFIVSSPRSGSSLLFLTLAQAAEVHTIGGESHSLIEQIPGLHPRDRGWPSNCLGTADATPALAETIAASFYRTLRDRDGRPPAGPAVMIEKTPKNSLRVPFFAEVWPDARFVYLYRDSRETLSSMIEAWNSGRFRTYPLLPGWTGTPWSLLLVPGWRDLVGRPLPEIVAHQWAATTGLLLDSLDALPTGRVIGVSYADFLADPQETMAGLCGRLGLGWDRTLSDALPLSPTVVTAPSADKWRRDEAAIEAVWPIVEAADQRAREALARYR